MYLAMVPCTSQYCGELDDARPVAALEMLTSTFPPSVVASTASRPVVAAAAKQMAVVGQEI